MSSRRGKGALEDPQDDKPAELLDSKEAHRLTRLALSRMQPRQAQLLSLRYSGMTYKDIAGAMGLAPASIGPLLLRAEREIRQDLIVLFPGRKYEPGFVATFTPVVIQSLGDRESS